MEVLSSFGGDKHEFCLLVMSGVYRSIDGMSASGYRG